MWNDYSISYIKNNRTAGISVMVAAFISALLLSILCSLFYNFWIYDVERIKAEEGDWQGRFTGKIDAEILAVIQNYANVEKVVVNEELSDGQEIVVNAYFKNMRTILEDMPRIAELAGLSSETVTYHYSLLNQYLIRDPDDPAPRLLLPFYLMITALACISLIMVIHNAFAVSMNDRIHQFGIFSSIGATPSQIRTCLLQEAFILCTVPIAAGNFIGIFVSMGVIAGTNAMLADVAGRLQLPFSYHPLILVLSLLAAVITVWVSAWIPARKMSRVTPLEAIKNTGEFQLKRKRNSRLLSAVFGVEGELAGNALKAQEKALRTAAMSLTFSFLAFTLMQCFFTLSGISTTMTYFERYQNVWDIMVTVKNAEVEVLEELSDLQSLTDVQSGAAYQKATAKRVVEEDELSAELRSSGILPNAPNAYVSIADGAWTVNAPILILDDASFLEYCRQIGAEPSPNGAVIINKIPDLTDPNFRDRQRFPYLNATRETTVLHQVRREDTAEDAVKAMDISIDIPVLSYTQQLPALKEAYGEIDYYELVHVIPVSVWTKIKDRIGGAEDDSYIRILAKEDVSLEELNKLAEKIEDMLGGKYEIVVENRIQDKINNDAMIDGMMLILGGFCVLLAVIGIGNVFSNTLGFVRRRRREFARYLSIGLTTEGNRKMFCIEALVLAGRPILITLILSTVAVGYMLRLSYLEPMVFIRRAPVISILVFILAIFVFVGLAYYLGGRRVLKSNLIDALRDDTMM